ncbi:acyltransferase family protein [Cobetia sp. 10Alg 146]|uniref:acyltransferase family protein n=1 Tax=Cobetia sp. 10Alg 146 TaxID=3040019 RepID=UPI0024497194|nr:acyltransferase family protein [Cobetia sp. 10Alg 146]MDH2292313.1 acyltransferase family protein [Cobetia sp. 10Alg 146]
MEVIAVRLHGLDLLRSILMLAGVLYHASLVIGPNPWGYNSYEHTLPILYSVVHLTHYFRMEAFFSLSGFFSALVLIKKGNNYFFIGRLKKLLIPLIMTVLFINPIQVIFLYINGEIDFSALYNINGYIAHTWFLISLFVISFIFICLPRKALSHLRDLKTNKLSIVSVILVFLSCVIFLYIPRVINVLASLVLGDGNGFKLFSYFLTTPMKYIPYFLLGVLLFLNYGFRDTISKLRIKFLLFFLVSSLIGIYCIEFYNGFDKVVPLMFKVAIVPLQFISSLSFSLLVFKVFSSERFKKSELVNFLVRSSLVVFLFHQPVLIISSYYLDLFVSNSFIYYVSIVLVTYAISFIIFIMIERNKVLNNLFGGWKVS